MLDALAARVLLFDGAMGTHLQSAAVPADAWAGREGCNEWLNVAAPDLVRGVHERFLDAGADAVETNTLGGSAVTLEEYGLGARCVEINRAAARLAREAADARSTPARPRFVFGSIGPGTRLPTLGQIDFDALADGIRRQAEGLLDGGVDGLLLETCQDPLQIKAGLQAVESVLGRRHDKIIYVSVTVERNGALLIGSSVGAVIAALAPYPIDILGLNCATGPDAMRIHLDEIAAHAAAYVGCMPNAGLPVIEGRCVRFPLSPADFAREMAVLAREVPLNVAGGCCGTTPEHIRALAEAVRGFAPPPRALVRGPDQVSSLFAPVDLSQSPPPLYIGERANATGSRAFRDALLAERHDQAFHVLVEQEDSVCHVVDLSCAYAGRDERRDLVALASRAARECRLPLMLDSTQPEAIEAGLKRYGGRALINSVHFEGGEERAARIVELARRHGAALVGLTIDEQGMAMDAGRKVAIARRLVDFCSARGLRPGDLLIDPLTFTIGSGDASLRAAARETIEAIRRIRGSGLGARTVLGASNISYGLKPAARRVLNAVFLDRAIRAGLDACIVNVAQMVPLSDLSAEAIALAAALIEDDRSAGDPLTRFIEHFEAAGSSPAAELPPALPPEDRLKEAIVRGRTAWMDDAVPPLLKTRPAEDILNGILIPAMREVGRLFNDGSLQLPFVLKSAEVMKQAVNRIRPHFTRSDSGAPLGTIVIATVAGDVHDIGKNLVDIILSNNGFRVVNLGTKVPVERMIEAVREQGADVLGMSGLLVKSAHVMAENMKALEASGLRVPVLLGGAALTPGFVAESCQPLLSEPVIYCRDAFAGLARMQEYAETRRFTAAEPVPAAAPPADSPPAAPSPIEYRPAPSPPFWGHRIARSIPMDEVAPLLNTTALVRGRWGYRRGRLSAEEYAAIIEREAEPRLRDLQARCIAGGLFQPGAAYGYFRCRGEGETLFVRPEPSGAAIEMRFPRQRQAPGRSIPDFFRRDEDVAGFFVVTLGGAVMEETARLLADHRYQDYLLLHGYAVEMTDALAEYWHRRMRLELGFTDGPMALQDYIVQKYRGSRFGFGYPACPDLGMNAVCCELVHAGEIGVRLSENFMMVPEVSTSALVAHHPLAKYFNV